MTGTGLLVRLAVRAERVIVASWTLLIVALCAGTVSYVHRFFPTPEALRAYADVIDANPVFLGLGGPVSQPSVGAMAAWRAGGLPYLLAGWMAVSLVIRRTRAEEDTGRMELLLAGALGRYAPVTAALLTACGACLLVGAASAAFLIAAAGLGAPGSLAYGAAIAVAGCVFAAVAALTAQLAQNARTARALALTALGLSYVLRYVGDASGHSWLVWLSPLGWSHLVRPYGDSAPWPLAFSALATALVLAAAYRLVARRDLGEGLLPVRQGPAEGPSLRGPFALAWRLQRGLLARWLVGVVAAATLFAGLSGVAPRLAEQPGNVLSAFIQRYGGPSGDPVDAYLWIILLFLGYTTALYPVLAMLRLHAEETTGLAEALLATATSRLRWATGHLAFALGGTVLLMGAGGLVTGLIAGSLLDAPVLPRVMAGALGQVAAAWVVGAVAAVAVCALPRISVAVSWAAWALVFVVGDLCGPLIGLWGWGRMQPFHYVPNTVAGARFAAAPLLTLLALTALLVALALARLRTRDLN
ncbi:polyketide antibiotic transporter [Nonomuraea sp. NPDC049152]|uniref:ABC transporter permease n=1 Tax=Nonomuraea sp. NPDC049152 TaxID=3154350 RepID=UPI0033C2A75C